jgi:hypothetical protein
MDHHAQYGRTRRRWLIRILLPGTACVVGLTRSSSATPMFVPHDHQVIMEATLSKRGRARSIRGIRAT